MAKLKTLTLLEMAIFMYSDYRSSQNALRDEPNEYQLGHFSACCLLVPVAFLESPINESYGLLDPIRYYEDRFEDRSPFLCDASEDNNDLRRWSKSCLLYFSYVHCIGGLHL